MASQQGVIFVQLENWKVVYSHSLLIVHIYKNTDLRCTLLSLWNGTKGRCVLDASLSELISIGACCISIRYGEGNAVCLLPDTGCLSV